MASMVASTARMMAISHTLIPIIANETFVIASSPVGDHFHSGISDDCPFIQLLKRNSSKVTGKV
jgi:hypothetical protein